MPRTLRARTQMRPRSLALGLAFAHVLAAGLGCSEDPAATPGDDAAPSAIVLIVVDTLRTDRLSLYGHTRATTPRLEALAREATVYERAYATAPWTTPSVASLLSSHYPTEIGVVNLDRAVPDSVVMLPERLRDAGYATGAVVSHDFVSAKWGFDQGFDEFDERFVRGPQAVTSEGISALAEEWIERHADERFFLFLHYFDPHYAYVEHADTTFGPHDYRGWFRSGMTLPDFMTDEHPLGLDEADLDEVRRIYDSEIAFTDRAIGRVLDALRAHGRWDDALVVVTADHGEEFLDHGALNHTKTLYDELVRVPLVVRYPGRAPARVATPVAVIDLYPTVLDVAGLAPDAALRGRSLARLDADAPPRPIFLETSFGQDLDGERRTRRLRAVVLGSHKLIVEAGDGTRPSRAELYDLARDPLERRDLGTAHPAMRRLAPLLQRWLAETAPKAERSVEIDAEERARLEALGYH